MQEKQVQSLDQEEPLEKEKATHSSILAYRIPWTESLAGYSPWGRKESEMTEQLTPHLCSLAIPSPVLLHQSSSRSQRAQVTPSTGVSLPRHREEQMGD